MIADQDHCSSAAGLNDPEAAKEKKGGLEQRQARKLEANAAMLHGGQLSIFCSPFH